MACIKKPSVKCKSVMKTLFKLVQCIMNTVTPLCQTQNCYRFNHALRKSDGQNYGSAMPGELKAEILDPIFVQIKSMFPNEID